MDTHGTGGDRSDAPPVERARHRLGEELPTDPLAPDARDARVAAILLVENGFAFYVYSLDPVLSVWFSEQVPDGPWVAMAVFHVLEAVAVALLTYVTLG
ncbi:hypothetical protein [Halosegnis rubeus]|uniref:hypothetical protein n=1 Tax=Halosegnis rubeus TaxID=2212850 RepID=UPI001CEC0E3F|nr:hypothetical protein [Halosegnis rubeus]